MEPNNVPDSNADLFSLEQSRQFSGLSAERIGLAAMLLETARAKLYEIAGGSRDSGRTDLSVLSAAQLAEYFRAPEFRSWIAAENQNGKRVVWLTDLDKTMGAGDNFILVFEARARYGLFTEEQGQVLRAFLEQAKGISDADRQQARRNSPSENALLILELWKKDELGQPGGLSLFTLWNEVYWPSEIGMTKTEKQAMLRRFAPEYIDRIFLDVPDMNAALRDAGGHMVIVTNGDEAPAKAIAPFLNIDPRNVVGAKTLYDASGRATGDKHSYEQYDKVWAARPQPGKVLNFRYWLYMNERRGFHGSKVTVAGMNGDSAASDSGPAFYLGAPEIGNFMVNTPGEHDRDRILKFRAFAHKYGAWQRGHFITLEHREPAKGPFPI